ncbi:sensor histidine kinase [Actinosynnema sp. NPDC059335]|uniref:sensor histidine kinase n=1 Tax=Actinosynnema sp. NPDC059335 TaxID=3346804 RepID=UPI00366E4450
MRNGAVLAVLALAGLANGVATDALPAWRQVLYPVLAVLVYLHGRHLPVRRGGVVLGAVAAVGVVLGAVRLWEGVGALASLGLSVALPWLAGRFRRQQAELVEAGRERIARLERTRELVAEQARLRERARIAADMHDSLGHELALIALRAGALELTAESEPTRLAAAGLRESAVTATDRLRHTVGVLREGAPPLDPPDEAVEALVARAAGAGLPVVLTRTGDSAPLSPLVDRAVHRVVQEALTNAARHAPGAPVTAEVRRERDGVLVTVTNPVGGAVATGGASAGQVVVAGQDGAAGPAAGSVGQDGAVVPGGEAAGRTGEAVSGGSGLAGLAERVRLLGGTVTAGAAGGRFTVTARIPERGGA